MSTDDGSLRVWANVSSASFPLYPTTTFDDGRVMMMPMSRVSRGVVVGQLHDGIVDDGVRGFQKRGGPPDREVPREFHITTDV
jgi:hypothetical protein